MLVRPAGVVIGSTTVGACVPITLLAMLPIVIMGAGGMGREALAWAIDTYPERQVVGFLEDRGAEAGKTVAGVPVLGTADWLEANRADCVVAIGAPRSRQRAMGRLHRLGMSPLTVVHPSAYVGPGVRLGEGTIVCPNVTLTRDIMVGDAVIVNYGAQIGHDCRIGDFVFVAPGVNLAGNVAVGVGTDIGIGASIIQGTAIGAWTRVGAGAAVIHDIPDGVTAVGVPCRPLPSRDG